MITYSYMGTNKTGEKSKKVEPHLIEKRDEFIFSLNTQGYNNAEIGRIFNLSRVRVFEILKRMPDNYVSPWKKVQK